ncbi:MAG: glycosyltransferase family 9 protein [Pantoea sp.]|uniref:Glycosyl transferase family 9 n=1 Tax=Pantoea phytobeneficialis TaxID=2052056 RepID=A0AAP9KRR2_9GAMM|nr:glycosyltransferase family 9 protein [Pantoea phytobeneficialis]MDO6407129.1 glycosyltransferase family 9 protein [Pantoea phytobeneficialis]QGR09102.1 glycosyl transferase family 9 [Pantoea phytobeneficialis]
MKKKKLYLIDQILTLYSRFFSRETAPSLHDLNPKTVVIYSTTALGDFLMNTPAIWSLKNRFPASQFILVSSKKNKDLVSRYQWFDKIYIWDNKLLNYLPLFFKLRRQKPDLSVILHGHFPYDVMSAVLTGSKVIVRDHYGSESPLLNKHLDHYSGYFDDHTIKRKLKLIESLGAQSHQTRMHLPESESSVTRSGDHLRIGFQLGASKDIRRWPLTSFCQLVAALLTRWPDCEIIVTGAPHEQHLEQEFIDSLPLHYRKNVTPMAGKTNLSGLINLIRSLDLLVTGDTGPMHIAVAAQVRTVSLFSTANPRYTGPCQDSDRHIIIHRPPEDDSQHPMTSITVEEVEQAIVKLVG